MICGQWAVSETKFNTNKPKKKNSSVEDHTIATDLEQEPAQAEEVISGLENIDLDSIESLLEL